jgi:hypothetical protein
MHAQCYLAMRLPAGLLGILVSPDEEDRFFLSIIN